MVALIGLDSIGGPGAGFLLPIFGTHANANHAFIQRIDRHNNVSELVPVLLEGTLLKEPIPSLEIEIGQPGLWAFRDETNKVHLGDAQIIQNFGFDLLSCGGLENSPMAAAELVQFCSAEAHFPDVMKAAFAALAKISSAGANTWLDTMVLLPAIKADLSRNARSIQDRRAIREVVAVSSKGVTDVFGHHRLSGALDRPTSWSQLAKIFGISKIQFHAFDEPRDREVSGRPQWTVSGIGGIARFVMKRAPFHGALDSPEAPRGGAFVKGPSKSAQLDSSMLPPLLIGISGSDLADVKAIEESFIQQSDGSELRHLINVRPTGFGTPKPSKASPQSILQSQEHLDGLWLIAAHRLRQTGRHTNAMSASNVACRFVRAALNGLIWSVRNGDPGMILAEKLGHPKIGVVGAARYNAQIDIEEMIRRALYSMLCEDTPLHSAQRIVLLWPYAILDAENHHTVQLGRHRLGVELYSSPNASGVPDVIGFAMNVQPSKKRPADFADLCISIASGYNWRLRDDDSRSLIFENEGEAIRLWPISERERLAKMVCEKSEFGPTGDLIITNQTLTKQTRRSAMQNGWGIVHYSEMERWMRSNYDTALFADW
ncbi:MAG: hypothetical protein E2598_08100 [Sphingobium sp.]|nr:hypothetical protein [Sphingobium sp.]